MGIAAEIKTGEEKKKIRSNILQQTMPEDLAKFGLIPEFIGRLPVLAVLNELTEEALLDILIKPKNALVNQYKKLFSFDGVELRFEDAALKAIAQESIKRNTGARGLRGVMEGAMLDIMFEIPSKLYVKECIIDEAVILEGKQPKLVYRTEEEIRELEKAKDSKEIA